MPQAPATPNARLHLPSLTISGFRGIDHVAIPRLGRVTLLAGKNGVGKTTVLDAARVYAARGHPRVLMEVLRGREEFTAVVDDDGGEVLSPDIAALTHSGDCVRGFAHAAAGNEDVEGVLVRLERNDGGIRAVEYSESELKVAADQRIEVR